MAKLKARYVCQACGSVSHRWQGQCADCAEWNTLVQEAAEVIEHLRRQAQSPGRRAGDPAGRARQPRGAARAAAERDSPNSTARSAAGSCPDRRCWSAAIPASASRPCCSRSRRGSRATGTDVVYVSGEELAEQVRLRAVRLGLGGAPVRLAAATSVRDILTTVGDDAPALLVIDSIQTMHSAT